VILYMWFSIIATVILAVHAVIAVVEWSSARNGGYSRDRVEVAKRATYAKWSIVAILAGPLWPVAVPTVVVYGLFRLFRALNDSEKTN